MKNRLLSAIVFGLALTLAASAQDANPRGGSRWTGLAEGDSAWAAEAALPEP
jgi:hypothetical protein